MILSADFDVSPATSGWLDLRFSADRALRCLGRHRACFHPSSAKGATSSFTNLRRFRPNHSPPCVAAARAENDHITVDEICSCVRDHEKLLPLSRKSMLTRTSRPNFGGATTARSSMTKSVFTERFTETCGEVSPCLRPLSKGA